MKKILIILTMLVVVSGCSKEKEMNCTYENKTIENKYTSEVRITYKDNKVINAVNIMTYQDEELASTMCELFKKASDAEDNLECDGNKITMKNYHKSLSESTMSIDELKSHMIDNNYTCK